MNVELLEFRPDDLAAVVAAVADAGWVNVQPDVDEVPEAGGFFAVFSGQGPAVPFGTWHRGDRSLGLQHGTGPKLARRLTLPPGWRVVQDHPRRGLVLRVPDGVTDADALAWLVATATEVATVPLTGR